MTINETTLITTEDKLNESNSVLAASTNKPGTELTPQQQERVERIVATIDITNPATSLAYGTKIMSGISQFSDTMISRVKAKDADFVGEQLTDLVMKVKGFDVETLDKSKNSILAKIPLLGHLFNSAKRTMIQYDTLSEQIDTVVKELDKSMTTLLRDIETMEQLFVRNRDFYDEATLYITAGRQRIEHVKQNDLSALRARVEQSANSMDGQAIQDLVSQIDRFERRLHDLDMSKMISVQTAPQIRMMQSQNQTLAEKIQQSVTSTIPLWKNQIVIALAIASQKKAVQLQKMVSNTTNDLLKKNAEMLQQTTIETAREVERSIVDIETLREVQNRLVNTLEETVSIANEARSYRANVERELVDMEQDLRSRLSEIGKNRINM